MLNLPPSKIEPVFRLLSEGKLEQADSLARRLVAQHPGAPHALDLMRTVALQRQDFPRAVHYARRLVEVVPADVRARADLALTLLRAGEHDEAIEMFRALARGQTSDAWPREMLLTSLFECGRLAEAEAVGREAMVAFPHSETIFRALASALLEQGMSTEAAVVLREVLRRSPANAEAAAMLACTMNYGAPVDPVATFAAHENWGRLLAMADLQQPYRHVPPAAAARRTAPLRMGFVSSDLRRHSVASFIEPVLAHADPSAVRPLLYMTIAHSDDVTLRLGALARRAGGALRTVAGLQPAALAALLHAERLDVLIELNGLTLNNCLAALRLKPAPVQITFCGYPATTGVRAIDYRIVDSITDPPGHERWMVERPLRLDHCFLCFQPPADAPATTPPPCMAAGGGGLGRVTFGSFNNILKVNDAVIDAWCALLARVPDARLVLKGRAFSSEPARHALLGRFAARAVDLARVEARAPVASPAGHLAAYADVDIALDTFPYTGTTTTCEALYMGVPVVTLCPPPDQSLHAGRVSASLLSAVGLHELIAPSLDAYLDTAAALAADPARLSAYRASLRARLLASPLCDGAAYARRFTNLVRDAWTRWAEPPSTLSITGAA